MKQSHHASMTSQHFEPRPERCADCRHFAHPPGDRLIEGSAFGRCMRQPTGHYMSPRASCPLQPSGWRRRNA